MRRKRRSTVLLASIIGLSLLATACGDDDDTSTDSGGDSGDDSGGGEGGEGGEVVDLGTFVGGPPEHIDPALNVTLDAYQVTNSLYDGLTDIDASDPDNVKMVPQVAESYEPNEDATVWTFKIREGLKFSNGEDVLPSSFSRAWERATVPEFAGDYSYLFEVFIKGGAEKLAGTAQTISGITADDDAMTFTVELTAPYANFDAVAGFQIFFPMPSAVDGLADQNEWENGMMIGNGPFMLEEARNDETITLIPNPEWDGSQYDSALDLPSEPILDRVTFQTSADPDTAYNAFEAGEGDTANIPPARSAEADENYGTTLDVNVLGTYFFEVKWPDAVVGGEENKLLRQAISQAIDRQNISDRAWDGFRPVATGITPPGMPGYEEGLCEVCDFDRDAAQEAYDEWQAAGNELTEPIKIQFNSDAGHETVVDLIISDLGEIGIEAERDPRDTETYFTQLADGACIVCRSGWYADYPAYDNFLTDLFGTAAIGGNNHGFYSNPEFDELVAQAKATTDADEQADLFHQAEQLLLNEDIGVFPLLFYVGDYAYNDDKIADFPMSSFGLITWEKVSLN